MTVTKMYDDVNLHLIPPDAPAVAGYVSGSWRTYPDVVKQWPHARHLSIATNASVDAECLDMEPGDATVAQVPAWVKRQHARGIRQPVVYCSLSNAQAVVNALHAAGVDRSQYRLWTAHYTGRAHRCSSSCGLGFHDVADATQWTNRAQGKSLDESLLAPTFFGPPPHPLRWYATWTLAKASRIKGGAVRALQRALNRHGSGLAVDDELGPATYGAAESRAYDLGVSNRQLRRGITLSMRRLLEGKRRRSPAERIRSHRRANAVDHRIKRAINEVVRLQNLHLTYAWGGGHVNPATPNGPGDCSWFASRIAQVCGLDCPTGTTYDLAKQGESGTGQFALYIKNPPDPHEAHVIVKLGKLWAQCGGRDNPDPRGGPHFFKPTPGRLLEFPIHRRWPGL